MLQNYFKIAWRTLLRQWQYGLINIAGLATGMTCCILISLYIHHERSYDRFHNGADRIYRITRDELNNANQPEPSATTPRAMANAMLTDFAEIEAAATLLPCRQMPMQHEDKQFYEDRVFEADSNLFKVFTFPFVSGSPNEAFLTPQSMVITESTAVKYFGSNDPVGEIIRSEGTEYFITAVIKDVPSNSHFRFDVLIPLSTIEARFNTVWGPPRYHTYIKLKEMVDPIRFEIKLASYAQEKYERRPSFFK